MQDKVQYVVDKVEQVRETSLVLESGATLPCDVLVNAREPLLQPVRMPFGCLLDGREFTDSMTIAVLTCPSCECRGLRSDVPAAIPCRFGPW